MAYGWTQLAPQTTEAGATAVTWLPSPPVADATAGFAVVLRNGVQAAATEVGIGSGGLSVSYIPAEPFEAGEMVWGWYVSNGHALPPQTPTEGAASVQWTGIDPPIPDGAIVGVFRNGVEAQPDEVVTSAGGATLTYTPAEPFTADETVSGWWQEATTDVDQTTVSEASIVAMAMEILRTRLGLDGEEIPDSALWVECLAVLTLYTRQFEAIGALDTLSAADAALLARVVALTTGNRMISGIMFSRSSGAQSIADGHTKIDFGGGRAIAVIREDLGKSMQDEAARYFGMLTGIRTARAAFAAAHSPYQVGGRLRSTPPLFLWWRGVFDDMFWLRFPAGYQLDVWP